MSHGTGRPNPPIEGSPDEVVALRSGTVTAPVAAPRVVDAVERAVTRAATADDLLEAVAYDRVGVSSRAELVAKLFAEQYADTSHEAVVHAD